MEDEKDDGESDGERRARVLRQAQDERALMVSLSNHVRFAVFAFDVFRVFRAHAGRKNSPSFRLPVR